MRTLRLLIWLRWRIGMNTTTSRGRWAAAGLTALFALALSPLWVGGAFGAYAFALRRGPQALLVVFGICQLLILWVSLLTGAMGRLFELDKLNRYPLRPLDVYTTNTLASLGEPIVLMTFPALGAAGVGVGLHSGALAGLAALAGAVALLLVTGALLQLLLALLDDLLRREWMRYVAAFFFTLTIVGFQLVIGRASQRFAEQAQRAGVTPRQLADGAIAIFERLATVAGPASIAGAHPRGPFAHPLSGIATSLALLVVPTLLGARVMARASLRGAVNAPVRARDVASSAGGFAARWPGLTTAQSLLVGRELLYVLRTPALLYQMAVVPLTVIGITFLPRTRDPGLAMFMPLFIMISTLSGRNLLLWGYDGPGVRTLFLLPVAARDLVLTKNLAWLASVLLEAALIFTVLAAIRPAQMLPELPMVVPGYLGLALVAGVVGTWVSITRPMRPAQQGLARRSPGGVVGVASLLAMLAVTAAVVLAVLAARALTPDRYDLAASTVVTTIVLVAAAGVWWVALDRNADLLEQRREGMIDALAKSADA